MGARQGDPGDEAEASSRRIASRRLVGAPQRARAGQAPSRRAGARRGPPMVAQACARSALDDLGGLEMPICASHRLERATDHASPAVRRSWSPRPTGLRSPWSKGRQHGAHLSRPTGSPPLIRAHRSCSRRTIQLHGEGARSAASGLIGSALCRRSKPSAATTAIRLVRPASPPSSRAWRRLGPGERVHRPSGSRRSRHRSTPW